MADFPYCLNSSTIRPTPILEKITIAAETGYSAIELWHDDIDAFLAEGGSLADIRKAVDDQNLTVPFGTSLTAVASVVTADGLINGALVNVNNTTLTTTSGLANNADMVLIDSTVEGPVNNASGSTVTVLGTVDFNGLEWIG